VSGLTTHVLDTMLGKPAAGLQIELWRHDEDGQSEKLKSVQTNADGRVDAPLLDSDTIVAGRYELRFFAGDYHRQTNAIQTQPAFLDMIPVCFGIADTSAHYHVPLLLSPYGYSTYRGS